MAEVNLCEPVVTDCFSELDTEKVNAYLCCHGNNVPLTELYPVYDESGQQDETALAIEHVRYTCVTFVISLYLHFNGIPSFYSPSHPLFSSLSNKTPPS